MQKVIFIGLYICIGILGGKLCGYRGLLDITIWPVTIPLSFWLHRQQDRKEKKDDGNIV